MNTMNAVSPPKDYLLLLTSHKVVVVLLATMVDSSSTSTRSSLFAIPSYDDALFKRIHEAPTYLTKHENEESTHKILQVLAAITILHLLLLFIMKMLPSSSSQKSKQEQSKAAWKASYQLTNLLVNLLLGSLGIYYELLSNSHTDHSILNKIIGYSEIRYFAIIQIGYQLWALPIGILFVGEQTSMIIHHVAVIAVASVSCFLTCGFRYFNPYFYGFIEISSVPLSVMNAFKNNPEWIKKYPGVYSKVRLVFGLTFLLVRVIIWTPVSSILCLHICMLCLFITIRF